uniref:Uncharacterized protein n=1 Tax=Cacopsylla melanoneura TaxID=428564 RepID=A0A8D9F193_9HEMI
MSLVLLVSLYYQFLCLLLSIFSVSHNNVFHLSMINYCKITIIIIIMFSSLVHFLDSACIYISPFTFQSLLFIDVSNFTYFNNILLLSLNKYVSIIIYTKLLCHSHE